MENVAGNEFDPEPFLDDGSSDPCAVAQQQAANMSTIVKQPSVLSKIAEIPVNSHVERGFMVYAKYDKNIVVHSDGKLIGYRTDNTITIGTRDGIDIPVVYTDFEAPVAQVHFHPVTNYAAPSADDIYKIISATTEFAGYAGTIVLGADGSQYALTITNPEQAAEFYSTMAQNLDGKDWNRNSELGKAFDAASAYYEQEVYKNNVNKKNLAYEMAMAAVLQQFNAGVTLHKSDPSRNFKPIMVKTSTPNPDNPEEKTYTQDCL